MATNSKQTTSNTTITSTAQVVLTKCAESFLSTLCVNILDQDLTPTISGGTVYATGSTNIKQDPPPFVRTIDPSTNVETPLFEGTDYTVNYITGEITLAVATSDIVRVDYSYRPLSDVAIDTLFNLSIQEVAVLIRRKIDPQSIPAEYEPAICLQLVMNVIKTLMLLTRDFFTVSVAGKSVSKNNVPAAYELIIKEYQSQLMAQVNQLRHWNTTNRLE